MWGDDAERFRMFVESANDIFYTLTPEGVFNYVSPKWTQLLGHEPHEVAGQAIENFVHPEDVELCRIFLERIITSGKAQAGIQYRIKKKSGQWQWHESNASLLKQGNDGAAVFLAVARDVTEKKEMEEALYESNDRLENLLLELPVAIMIIDYNTREILEINQNAMLILGYSGEQLVGRKCTDYVCPMKKGECPILDQGMEANHSEQEVINASGERVPVHKSAITMHHDGRNVILECFTDISRMKEMERRLQEMAQTDELTGLCNRRYFVEQARLELARSKRYGNPVSMIGFDIDHFKHINDRFGHPAGDAVLRAISRISRETLRETDIIARVGGEEFGVILPECAIDSAGIAAERLRKSIEACVCEFEGIRIQCTISLGIAQYSAGQDDLEGLMKRTDKALYRAKDAGRNRICKTSDQS